MATPKRGSMRNVLTPVDPTTQGGSLAGTMAPVPLSGAAIPAKSTLDFSASGPAAQAQPDVAGQQKDYEAADEHEPLSEDEWYQLLHNLGSAMQRANPDIQKAVDEMAGKPIDYEKEFGALRDQIKNRATAKAPSAREQALGNLIQPSGLGAGLSQQASLSRAQQSQKQNELDALQEQITTGHIQDLQKRGKFQEALATLLLQKGLTQAGEREKQQAITAREKLKGQNALDRVRVRAQTIADTFHFNERMRLKLLDIAGKVAQSKLQKYGNLDPVTGGFTIKPDQYDQWQDETMSELYQKAHDLQTGGTIPEVPGAEIKAPKPTEKKPATSHGQVGGKPGDPLGIR